MELLPSSSETLLYKTFSLCPRCTLLEKDAGNNICAMTHL
jgi:hypothetical protein